MERDQGGEFGELAQLEIEHAVPELDRRGRQVEAQVLLPVSLVAEVLGDGEHDAGTLVRTSPRAGRRRRRARRGVVDARRDVAVVGRRGSTGVVVGHAEHSRADP